MAYAFAGYFRLRHAMRPFFHRLLACTIPLSILASGQAHGQQGAESATPDLGGSLLQLGLGFLVVLAVLFASLWLLKRLTSPQGRTPGLMRVISSLAVGPRERVVLMEVGDQWLLVGVGPGHISKIGELPRQALTPGTDVSTPDFSAWLKRALERRPGKDA